MDKFWRNKCSGTIPKDSRVIQNEITTDVDQNIFELPRALSIEYQARANTENTTIDVPNHWKLSQKIFASNDGTASSIRYPPIHKDWLKLMAQKCMIPQTFLLVRPYTPSETDRAKDMIYGRRATKTWLVSIIMGDKSLLFMNPSFLYYK